jgi:hypothetical protein
MRTRKLAGVVLAAAFALAACGGGDDGGGGSVIQGDLDAADCAAAVAAMANASQAVTAAIAGGGGDLSGAADQLAGIAGRVPDEIKGDVQMLADGYAQVAQAWAAAGYDPASGQAPNPEQLAAIQQASATLSSADFEAAAERVSAWFQSNCSGG